MIHVLGLGLGPEHRTPEMQEMIRRAALVAGGGKILDEFGIEEGRRLVLTTMERFADALRQRAARGDDICVLADGDPLLYGIGASLLRFFAPGELSFHPNVSALQTACARFGLPWHDCAALSLHGRDDLAPLFAALTHRRLIALYTDRRMSPDAVAAQLLQRHVAGWRMHVAEALCGAQEKLATLSLEEAAQRSWHPVNVVLLERTHTPPVALRLGLDESALAREDGLMTKQPARALALSLLRLDRDSTLWDLGAGSGAVSLEAARLLTAGRVVAVERRSSRAAQIRHNAAHCGAWLVEVQERPLEDFLNLSAESVRASGGPTHVFLGGGATAPVLAACCALLAPGGRIVAAAVLLSTLETVRTVLDTLGWPLTVHQLMHHASSPLGNDVRLVPSNPVFLVETQKPSSIA